MIALLVDGGREPRAHLTTSAECIAALDSAAADARTTLAGTDEAHLQTRWSYWQAARW